MEKKEKKKRKKREKNFGDIAQELCEGRGGCAGLLVVPNSPYGTSLWTKSNTKFELEPFWREPAWPSGKAFSWSVSS